MSLTMTEETLENGLRKITLVGTLDAPSTMSIENEFQSLVSQKGNQVIIDLSGVDFMSSYGLRMFLVAAKEVHTNGGALYLAGPNQKVMQVIQMAGYDTMFPVYESVEEAIVFLTG
jgi:anti-anti-sigma factor